MFSSTPDARRSRPAPGRLALVVVALALALTTSEARAEDPASVLSWETGQGKSYVIPALELGAFIFGLNQIDRHFIDEDTYASDGNTIWRNLRTPPELDADPFSVNQLGHPYQGSVYQNLARSAGLGYWESLLYTIGGSFIWETAGERTAPSANDYVATAVAGSFLGEAGFRMASLLLENGGENPGFWRELGAALISPATGFNRLAFGDRFRAVFPSRDPAVFVRLRLGATLTSDVTNAHLTHDVKREEGSIDFYMAYGLPGKPGYRYTRPFDYFLFEFTAVPNASSVSNAVENLTVRGLLLGTDYEVGDDYRGLWGLFGAYDYLSPQIFRVATTSLSLGTVAQWWLSPTVTLQGNVLVGGGFGAAGTVEDKKERDYHYGVIPQAVLGLRLIFGDRAMLETAGRQYFVIGTGSGAGVSLQDVGRETIQRGNVGLSVRLFGPHAISVQYLISTRAAHASGLHDRQQSIEAFTISYNFLGHTRFGAVDWRPESAAGR